MNACVNSACGAPVNPGARFCVACGTRQDLARSAASCHHCGAAMEGGKFCTSCGKSVDAPAAQSRPSMPVSPRASSPKMPSRVSTAPPSTPPGALEEYRDLIMSFADDGVLDEGELQVLRGFALERGVTDADHQRLVKESKLFVGLPVALALDPKTCFLKAGSPSTLHIAIRNQLQSHVGLLREATLTYRCSTSKKVHTREFRSSVPAGARKQTTLMVDAPSQEGQYHLDGMIEARFLDGRVFRGYFELPSLLAAANYDTTGPQSVSINLQGDANMVKGGDLFRPSGREMTSGEIRTASGTWHPVEVQPVTEARLDDWCHQNQSAEISALARPQSRVRGEPQPCRAVLLRIQQKSTRPDSATTTRDVWLSRGDVITFGRDARRADFQAAVEPFSPPEQHRNNVAQSMRISSVHLRARIEELGGTLTDLGSSNGTTMGGRALSPQVPLQVTRGTEVTLADVLTLRGDVLMGDDARAHALHIRRVDNMPQRSYALAPEGLGLWPSDYALVGPRGRDGHRAPVLLDWHMGGLCVCNQSLTGVVRVPLGGGPTRIGVGQRDALGAQDRIHLGDHWIIFIAEVLPPRPGTF